MAKYIDLTGERFGFLLVLERDTSKNRTYYNCKCDCGNLKSIRADALKNGRVTSCGCYHKNVASKKSTNKKYNKYEIHENEVHLITSKGDIIKIDLEDFDKVKDYCWSKNSVGYAQARVLDGRNSVILMHRLIMNATPSDIVDHKNHNELDNRKSNLRMCSQSENMANQKLSKANTSGHKGVYWNKEKSKWSAQIGHRGRKIRLGYFENIEDAIKAREEAELKYFGKYRYKGE